MKKMLLLVRWMVGLLFIFSGLIKVNDPIGLSYKMQEFFEVWNMHFLNDYALFFSIAMNSFEVLAGVAIIIGWRIKLFSWLLLLLIIFFTFLTGYAHYSGKIKTCGCFGDCLPLTAAQSFYKDLFLLVLILFLFGFKQYIKSAMSNAWAFTLVALTLVISTGAQFYVLKHLPWIDCLPYKVGNNILQKMEMPVGATLDSMQLVFEYQKEGKTIEFDQEHFPENFDDSYIFISRKDKLVKKGNGLKPAIVDFSLKTLGGVDTTQDVLTTKGKYVLVLAKDAAGMEDWESAVKKILSAISEKGIPIIIVSAEGSKMKNAFPNYTVLNCDATVLKTAARVKPTFMFMNGAKIEQKLSYINVTSVLPNF
ncbi:BT_3928 family protein [Sediminibacterium sp.]|uniref:BT_3928 family protein n=1 Tax=Sediminibacterium sp. TaxID=1917865 RepID=UPI002733A55D|nr:BT_3928 family protein [Sediminibacterium sp.]MDP3393859.1 DoxX family protein [Sediminibacterium sp.]MDP3568811.1 DoxX family protein [Sediminibacterium sp.]